jgi:site-specific DNA recombinase
MDFRYYRCSETDAYRFGGERICSNTQARADTLENQIWENVCKILRNPGILEEEDHNSSTQSTSVESNVDMLIAHRQKLQHGMDRLIDSFAEGVIDKDQFTPRMNRTKTRISEIDVKIATQTSDQGRQARLQLVRSRITEISRHLQNELSDADWTTKREIIRAVIQRIEIGQKKVAVALRPPTDTSGRVLDPIMVTLSRA